MIRFPAILLITIAALTGQPDANADTTSEQKAVLVTGASSGIPRPIPFLSMPLRSFFFAFLLTNLSVKVEGQLLFLS